LVGERAKELALEDGVVYERYEIPAGSLNTFKMIIEEDFPKVKKYKKFLVEIDGEKMARMRNERGLSLVELARISKISKETLYRYEHGKTMASEEHVKAIERLLHAEMRRPVPLFARANAVQERTVLSKLGFESVRARSAPFDLVAKEEAAKEKIVAGEQADRRTLAKRAGIYQRISEVLQSHSCFILSESKRDEILGVPVVRKGELAELRKARELIKLIKERSA
ncbi:MAG: helix-turn-helix domain-containing protein, partial [Candidatus Micrarchaeota archaeon]